MFYGTGWKKPRFDRRLRSRKNLPASRFQRATGEIQRRATGEIVKTRVFLHDLTADGVGVFLTAAIPRGEEVFLVLQGPKHLFVRGRIVWCMLYRLNTRVISAENYQYRAGIRFEYDSASDRDLVTRYFDSLALLNEVASS